MTFDQKPPTYRVRVGGIASPTPRTKIRFGRTGGRYDGYPDLEVGAASVRGVSFEGFVFQHFSAEGSTFKACDFSRTAISGTFGVRRQTTFEDCTFDATRLANVEPGQARFVGCSFRSADLNGWNAVANEFVNCRFLGVVRSCNFWGAPVDEWVEVGALRPGRLKNEFRGNDFREAELRGVGFLGGVDIDAQLWPESSDYVRLDRFPERVLQARVLVEGWNDREAQAMAKVVLDVFSVGGFENQQTLFAHRWSFDTIPRDIMARVWATLEEPL
jgi:hypothetical protein